MSRVKTPLLSPSRSYNKMYCGFFFFKNMEIFDVPGLTLRHELKAGDLGRLIEFSGIYGHSDFDYPIAFEGYVATTFAEYVIDPKPRNRLWMVEDEQGLVGTIGVMDRGDSAQLRWFSVRPDWRENNLGNFLFGAAMEYIQENDFQKAWLSTFSESEIAVALYKRRGFRIMVETDVEIGGKNYREIVMEKSFLRTDAPEIEQRTTI